MSQPLLVLFEGPWIFSAQGKHIVATTFGDLQMGSHSMTHACSVGSWDEQNGLVEYPGCQGSTHVDYDDIWTGERQGPPATRDAADILQEAFQAKGAVYLQNTALKLKKQLKDRQIVLPVPDAIQLAGKQVGITVLDAAGQDVGMKPCVTAAFVYNSHATEAAARLHLRNKTSELFVAVSEHHLIFRMQFESMDGHDDNDHIKAAFAALVSRIEDGHAPIKMSIDIPTAPDTDKTTILALSAQELGLTKFNPPGKAVVFIGTPADCGTGSIGMGGPGM